MNSEKHSLKVERTAHYFTLGEIGRDTKFVWLACHGYGQTADKFIRKFDGLNSNEHFIIAPEGLSKFYWPGVGGIPVASWMTSRDRLMEIEDYVHYLDTLFNIYSNAYHSKTQFVFFGFSQGCATILRYLAHFQPRFSHIILWAGSFPRDIDYRNLQTYFQQGDLHLIYGTQDQYVTTESLDQEKLFLQNQSLTLKTHNFDGDHRVDKKVLMAYLNKILTCKGDL
ncbi:MAG: alpha/beta hydrolase [Saprospiraceae bacterium]|nr:alpha/beta hydrolase [Saprospiraceae bacterium]